MKVDVLAFGVAKDIFGGSLITIEITRGSVENLKQTLEAKYPRLKQLSSYMVAVNNEYAGNEAGLTEKDEIAIIPPVSGG